jgi:hypothetical protein
VIRNLTLIAIVILCIFWGRWLWNRSKRIWPTGPDVEEDERDEEDSRDPD